MLEPLPKGQGCGAAAQDFRPANMDVGTVTQTRARTRARGRRQSRGEVVGPASGPLEQRIARPAARPAIHVLSGACLRRGRGCAGYGLSLDTTFVTCTRLKCFDASVATVRNWSV